MKFSLRNLRRKWAFNDSPEGQLLLAVCSAEADENKLNGLLNANLIWHEILGRAIGCDVAPLLYYRLKDLQAVHLVPPAGMDRLKKVYQWHAARNMNLYAKLQEVRHAFAGEKIPLILLKGAVLADLVYGNVALRPMRDVDILVRRNDLDAADDLLGRMGYTPTEAYRPKQWYHTFHHHNVPHVSSDHSLILELHHNIVPPGLPVSIPAEDLWQDPRTIEVMNETALALCPEKLILHLCVHLAYENRFYRSLRSLSDIAATVAFYKEIIDWPKFISHVRAYKADRAVYYAFWLAGSLVHAEVPLTVLESLSLNKGNSLPNDRLLKFVIQRTISSFENEHTLIPAWVVKSTCGEFLLSDKTWRAMAILWRRFPPRYFFRRLFRVVGQRS